jgi:hypothetical protein
MTNADQSDNLASLFDAWQRCSARLVDLERVLDRTTDPTVAALIREVQALRVCTVELFCKAAASKKKGGSPPGKQALV